MNVSFKALPLLIVLATTDAFATDGYFAHGYGMKSLGMGGVAIALPQDALASASNPAGMGLIGDRLDFGLTWFKPTRESEIVGNGGPGNDGKYKGNETKSFIIPEFGYNHTINNELSVGVSVYGNGGMNTDYNKAIPLFDGTNANRAGIDLIQVFIAPTVAWKISPANTIGVAVNLAYQSFEAKGLQNFDNGSFTSSVGNVTNNGHDHSYGAGLHVGWIGQLTDVVTLGATYKTRTYMSKLDKYKGLFAEQGSFDIPSSYGLGLSVKATPKLTLAADITKINYSEVDSVGNSISNLFLSGNPLGSNKGSGFGWKDVTTIKVGTSYSYDKNLTLRAGYNHSS